MDEQLPDPGEEFSKRIGSIAGNIVGGTVLLGVIAFFVSCALNSMGVIK